MAAYPASIKATAMNSGGGERQQSINEHGVSINISVIA